MKIGTTAPHGSYTRYAGSARCRCGPCRAAKAEDMRARRQEATLARRTSGEPYSYVAKDIRAHGLSGYQNNGCRCPVCRAAKAADDRARYQRRVRSNSTPTPARDPKSGSGVVDEMDPSPSLAGSADRGGPSGVPREAGHHT